MRISDWSSDVCSSDLSEAEFRHCINLAIRVDHLACGPQRPESSRVPTVCGSPIVTKAKDGFLTSEKQALAIGKLPASDIWPKRSEEHTFELQSLMCTSYAVFCLQTKIIIYLCLAY